MAWAGMETHMQTLMDMDRSIGHLRTELRLHIQDDRHRLDCLEDEIEELRKDIKILSRKKAVDWTGILRSGWVPQIVVFLILSGIGIKLTDALAVAFRIKP